jgi:RNA polymerase sigma factor (sigma-70 family)
LTVGEEVPPSSGGDPGEGLILPGAEAEEGLDGQSSDRLDGQSDDRTTAQSVDGGVSRVDRDAELLAAFRDGDGDALEILIGEHYAATYGWALRYASAADDAEDLAQQAVLVTLEALARGGGPKKSMGLYLAKAVRNLAFNRGARLKRSFPVADFAGVLEGRSETLPEDGALAAALDEISDKQQWLLWQREVEGVPTGEIAERLGVSQKAASMALGRARRALASRYRLASARQDAEGYTKAGPGGKAGGALGLVTAVAAFVMGVLARRAPSTASAADGAEVDGVAVGGVAGHGGTAGGASAGGLKGVSSVVGAKAPVLLALGGLVSAVVATMIAIGSGGGDDAGAVFEVPVESGPGAVPVVRDELPGRPDSFCEVVWNPRDAASGQSAHFRVSKTPDVECDADVSWNGARLAVWDRATDRSIFLTPRPGAYSVRVTVTGR